MFSSNQLENSFNLVQKYDQVNLKQKYNQVNLMVNLLKDLIEKNSNTKTNNPQMKKQKELEHWEKFNKDTQNTNVVVILDKDGKEKYDKSYTRHFFNDYKLANFLNKSCKTIVQLGASTGEFINQYKQKKSQWNVIGYDYSEEAIKSLEDKGIIARMVDLNSLNPGTQQLTCADQLKEDIAKPANILLIRVLQYLDLKALNALLHFIINKAAQESVIFIASTINKKNEKPRVDLLQITRNYYASFFGPRTDMKFLTSKNVNKDDEILVVQKRKM